MPVITVADLKAHLAITGDLDDDLLEQKILVAEDFVEAHVGTAFADFDPIPASLLEAVRMLAGHLYANREATVTGEAVREVPFGLLDLIAAHKRWVFG